MKGFTTYITGESYAGFYVPYIADAFITADDDDYYKLGGVAINDPIIGDATLQQQAVILPFVEYWDKLFYLNETTMNALRWTHEHCGFDKYLEKYGTFPPPEGKFEVSLILIWIPRIILVICSIGHTPPRWTRTLVSTFITSLILVPLHTVSWVLSTR